MHRWGRLVAAVGVVTLVAAGCGAVGELTEPSSPPAGQGREPGGTPAPGGAPGAGAGSPAGGAEGTALPGATGPRGGVPPAAAAVDDRGPVGSLGRALLSPSVPRAVLEVDATPGTALAAPSRAALVAALAEHGGKAVVEEGGSDLPAQEVWTAADLRRLAGRHRSTSSSGEAASVYVLVLGGRFELEQVTGVAFGASAIAVFPDRVAAGLLPLLAYEQFEEAVVVHELGHLFGLVNLTGRGGFHEDPEHPGHSASTGSVMYWAIEDLSVGNVFRGGPPRRFDAEDRREMEMIRV